MTAPKERRAPSGSGGKSSVVGDSTVTQDYLKVVWAACEWGGAGASVTGLAKRMEVAPSTASENVARLVEEGLRPRFMHIGGQWADHIAFFIDAESLPEGGLVRRRWGSSAID